MLTAERDVVRRDDAQRAVTELLEHRVDVVRISERWGDDAQRALVVHCIGEGRVVGAGLAANLRSVVLMDAEDSRCLTAGGV